MPENAITPAPVAVRLGAGGVPVVSSRDVAEAFGKRHADVLRDIDVLLSTNADLRSLDNSTGYEPVRQCPPMSDGVRSWFIPAPYHDAKGEERPAYDLTRDGFTLLVMGWTGPKALAFKVAYINAFNAMEAEIKASVPTMREEAFLAAVREIVAPLAVRFDGQDRAIERVEYEVGTLNRTVGTLVDQVGLLSKTVLIKRRNLAQSVKRAHIEDIAVFGGRCPCCGVAEVLDGSGDRSKFAEFDHFYANSKPDGEHTWLICKPCHAEMTDGRVPRDRREAEFRSYQERRRRLPNRQVNLFD